jgi:hypothetical protein
MTTQDMNATSAAGASAIHNRALLVWLHISTWSARKYDKNATRQMLDHYNASSDAARVNKLLLPGDAKAYKTLTSLATTIRAEHYSNTLAWSDEGWRLLPTANYSTYTKWLRDRQHAFAAALADFSREYPALRTLAESLLNGMYVAADYPSVADLQTRFALSVEYAPVPMQGDIRVNLGADQVALIETAIAQRHERATATAVSDAWARLHEVVSKIAERLSQPDAIFRDTLISNAENVCDVLQRLNITDDPELEAMRVRVRKDLTRFSPETLRDVPSHRQQTADRAADILAQMSGIMGGVR